MRFLYAAYIGTWLVHISYILVLVRGIAKLRREAAELDRR